LILAIGLALKRVIPKRYHKKLAQIRTEYIQGYAKKSYSQEGEDMILYRIFEGQATGFYVDVGAHHPKRFSNTYFFYKKGWSGINIDATPGIMAKFKKNRRRDINLNVGVSSVPGELTLYIFKPALNTFDAKLAKERSENTGYKIKRVTKVKTTTLESILSENLGSNKIDFMSVDVEARSAAI
jgi:FkbM family methyltransferase